MEDLTVFTPNNHSKWQIEWKPVAEEQKESIRKVLLAHYRVKTVGEIDQVDEWERNSNNFRVCTELLDGEQKELLLRKNIKWQKPEDIHDVERIIRYLGNCGLPVPFLCPTQDGEALAEFGGDVWQAYDFIPGNHYRGTLRELKDAAKRIAEMHVALANATFVDDIKRKSKPRQPWTNDVWDEMLARARKRNSWVDILVDDNAGMIRASIEVVMPSRDEMERSPKQIIHRDLHPWNTIFENEKLKAMLDFSDAHFGE